MASTSTVAVNWRLISLRIASSSARIWIWSNRLAFWSALATWSAMVCRIAISSSKKADGCMLWMVIAPVTKPRLIRGSASSERVSGSNGFTKRCFSILTCWEICGWAVSIHCPIIDSPPTSNLWLRSTWMRPASPVPARSTAHLPGSCVDAPVSSIKNTPT